jgi:hypothetical protein
LNRSAVLQPPVKLCGLEQQAPTVAPYRKSVRFPGSDEVVDPTAVAGEVSRSTVYVEPRYGPTMIAEAWC